MRAEFVNRIIEVCGADATRVLELVAGEYEFSCASFVFAGPGHQSRHTCENTRPHPIEGYHNDSLYEWIGTSTEEVTEVWSEGLKRNIPRSRLIKNAPHEGYGCDICSIPASARP